MKKIILVLTILASIAAVSCNSKQAPTIGDKPLTTNVPSDDKTVKTGTPLSQWNDSDANKSITVNASVAANNNAGSTQTPTEYNLLERLYSTVWYQSESDYDDGRLETEEEFVFFNENSYMVKREYENGRIDGRDDYSKLEVMYNLDTTKQGVNKDRNACIVRNTEFDKYEIDVEYEGYYLVDRNTLYIIEGNNPEELKTRLENIINGNGYIDPEDKFVLSTKAL
ncbi:hypothetical protein [Brachyspira pulli]|uniref:hypothetical protein n=1 Tax=Brachyspira pulli TaxID=310721 RepID=UPI0030075E28